MSQIALDTIKEVRERVNEILAFLNKREEALKTAPPGAVEEIELLKEALDALPWKPYKNPKSHGAWIFSNLEDLIVQSLRDAIIKNKGNITLHNATYRFSGDDNKFISRYSKD